MERIKDLRSVTLPSGNLARRDVQSQLVSVPTGKFTRNCVLTGKSAPDMDYPIYLRAPGLVQPHSGISPEGLGYFDASEGTATNVFPTHNAIVLDSDYWAASSLGCWIAYHHELRPTMLRGYRFITYNGYTPRVWRVEGSNDNATWTTLHSVTVDWTWGDGKQVVEQEIPSANRDYFLHHRLIVDEFDASSIRIYYLQFWDAACSSAADFYLDVDAENPCQLAFADGYKSTGEPKDILFTINASTNIEILDFVTTPDVLLEDGPIACVLFAKYDSTESSVSFIGEPLLDNDTILSPEKHGYITSYPQLFDGDLNTYINSTNMNNIYGAEITNGALTSKIFVKIVSNTSNAENIVEISEDYGSTWIEAIKSPGSGYKTIYQNLDRVYDVTNIRVRYVYGKIFELRMYDASRKTIHKMSEGKFYEYDAVEETWNQVYKLPLGYFSLWKNPDGSAWEIGPFTPTHIPQMGIAPWFRKTSGGVAL